jgi:5-methyltetrahydropteroyltriglutamate--homocysteine methyltransferase
VGGSAVELISLLYGIYPRSENLRKAYGKWEKGKISSIEISDKIREESTIFYDLTREANLDYFTDPLFNWYDLLRPVALSIEGIALGPLTRYKETNTFYREPIIGETGKLNRIDEFREIEANPPLPIFHKSDSKSYLYFLPGINSFIKMSTLRTDPPNIRQRLKDIYLEMVERLKMERLLIYEPFEAESFEIYDDLIDATSLFLVVTGKSGKFTTGRKKKFVSIISEDPYTFDKFCEIPGLRIVDAQSTRIDDDILQKVDRLSDDFDRLIIANTESFDFLPRSIADKKLFNFKGGE